MMYLKIFLLLLMFVACILLFIWVFRPGSAKQYEELGNLPLHDDDDNDNKPSKGK